MKRFITGLLLGLLFIATIAKGSSVLFPSSGGTGTSTVPISGQVLIGNASGTYSPKYLTAGSGISIATSSGGITITGSGSLTTSTGLTTNSIPIITGFNSFGNSSFSQSAGTTLINGVTPIIDGGGDWIYNIIAPANTSIVGNLIQGGQIIVATSSRTLTAAQICTGGGTKVSGSSSTVVLTLPAVSTVSSTCGPLGLGTFNMNIITNNSTNTVTVVNGAGWTSQYSPGTPSTLPPGASWLAVGDVITATSSAINVQYSIFTSTSTLNVDYANSRVGIGTAQPSSTLHIIGSLTQSGGSVSLATTTINGELRGASTTLGVLTVTSCTGCGGGGGAVSTSSPITIGYLPYWVTTTGGLNGTSSVFQDVTNRRIGIGTAQPSSTLHIIGASAQSSDLFSISSSTGNNFFQTAATGTVFFSDGQGNTTITISPTSTSNAKFQINTATGTPLFFVASSSLLQTVGIGTNQPSSTLHIVGNEQILSSAANGALRVGFNRSALVSGSELAQFDDETGLASDWSFAVAGNGYPVMNLYSTNGTLTAPTTSTGSEYGELSFWGYGGTGKNKLASIVAFNNTSPQLSSVISFKTVAAGVTTPSEVMELLDTGNVWVINKLGAGTSQPSSTLHVAGNFQLSASSSVVTPSIGGGSLAAGACASATSSVDSTVVSSTAAFVTTPRNDPGTGFQWYTILTAPSTITTRVCAEVLGTPTATTYMVKIIK